MRRTFFLAGSKLTEELVRVACGWKKGGRFQVGYCRDSLPLLLAGLLQREMTRRCCLESRSRKKSGCVAFLSERNQRNVGNSRTNVMSFRNAPRTPALVGESMSVLRNRESRPETHVNMTRQKCFPCHHCSLPRRLRSCQPPQHPW